MAIGIASYVIVAGLIVTTNCLYNTSRKEAPNKQPKRIKFQYPMLIVAVLSNCNVTTSEHYIFKQQLFPSLY
jgi:hypothetical protein